MNKLLELVKQYDDAREKQVAKQNRKIEACEAKLETFMKNNSPSPSFSLDPSSPSFNPRVKTPPSSSVFQGKPLHYGMSTFPLANPSPPAPSNIPSGALTDQVAALQLSLTEQVAAIQMSQMNLSQYHSFPLPGFSYSPSPVFTTTTEGKEDFETLCIDGTQYCALVGVGGKKIDSIRDKSKANITIKSKTDKPPHMYYEVQIKGAKQSVDEAKTLVMNAIYISPR